MPLLLPRAVWAVPGLELGRWGQIKAFASGLFVLRFIRRRGWGSGGGPPSEEGVGQRMGVPSALSLTPSLPPLAGKAMIPQSPTGALFLNDGLGGARGRGTPSPRGCALPAPVPRSLRGHSAGPPGNEPTIDRWMLC